MKIHCVKECPKCGGNTNVINTRGSRTDGIVVRLRKCFKCDHTFETTEVSSESLLALIGASDRNEELERENLMLRTKVLRIQQFMKKEFPKEE